MKKRYTPIFALMATMLVMLVIGYVVPGSEEKVTQRILLDNAAGKVVFNHQKHFKDYDIDCASCHHDMIQQSENVLDCGSCHGIAFDEAFRTSHAATFAAKGDNNGIDSCATCHHMEFTSKDWGHDAHASDYGIDCASCHHEDTDIEPEPQDCANCHQSEGDEAMPALKDAVHVKCQSCHEDMFEAKVEGCVSCHTPVLSAEIVKKNPTDFQVSEQYANCLSCHVDQKLSELVPDRMTAFHTQCMSCHEEVGKGPYTKEQCNQCHTK